MNTKITKLSIVLILFTIYTSCDNNEGRKEKIVNSNEIEKKYYNDSVSYMNVSDRKGNNLLYKKFLQNFNSSDTNYSLLAQLYYALDEPKSIDNIKLFDSTIRFTYLPYLQQPYCIRISIRNRWDKRVTTTKLKTTDGDGATIGVLDLIKTINDSVPRFNEFANILIANDFWTTGADNNIDSFKIHCYDAPINILEANINGHYKKIEFGCYNKKNMKLSNIMTYLDQRILEVREK